MSYRNYEVSILFNDQAKTKLDLPEKIYATVIDPTVLITNPYGTIPPDVKILWIMELADESYTESTSFNSEPLWKSKNGVENEKEDLLSEFYYQLYQMHGVTKDDCIVSIHLMRNEP
jgi:hypothetical protein